MDSYAKIVQWNCRSITNKKTDLIYLLNKYDPFACALSETWLKSESTLKISGYACLREDRPDGYSGVAILIKNSLPFSSFSLPVHSVGIAAVAVIVNNICIVSVYIPHPSSQLYSELDNIISSLPRPFFING